MVIRDKARRWANHSEVWWGGGLSAAQMLWGRKKLAVGTASETPRVTDSEGTQGEGYSERLEVAGRPVVLWAPPWKLP